MTAERDRGPISSTATADSDDRQVIVRRSGVTVASRSVNSADRSQLIANAGLTPEEAAGMTLNEIAIAKFNRDADSENRQGSY